MRLEQTAGVGCLFSWLLPVAMPTSSVAFVRLLSLSSELLAS